jgi:ribosomal protein S27AE
MSSNYPPGVSGNEPQLTGEWPCSNCGATLPEEAECPECGKPMEMDDKGDRWTCSCGASCAGDECPGGCNEPDWDAERDRRDEEREERRGY